MSFQENLQIEINSVFNSLGFDQLQNQLTEVNAKMQAMDDIMSSAQGLNKANDRAREFDRRLTRAGLSMKTFGENVSSSASDVSSKLAEMDIGHKRFDEYQDAVSTASSQVEKLGGVVVDSNNELMKTGGISKDLARQFRRAEKMTPESIEISTDVGTGGDGEEDRMSGRMARLRRRLGGVLPGMAAMSAEFGKVAATKAPGAVKSFGGKVAGATRAVGNLVPSIQGLQMKLLGLQFTMLTVAFLFGGLMAGALGAAGVFEVLGNTLRFFFMPTALDVLDTMLDFQEFVMGLSRETRKLVGEIFGWISGSAILIGVIAALGKAVLSFAGGLSFLVGILGGPVTLLLTLASAFVLIAGASATLDGKLKELFGSLGNIANKLFEFTQQAGQKLATFLSKAFTEISDWFTSTDWGKVWGKVFDYLGEAKDKLITFLGDAVEGIRSYWKSEQWDKVWASFFDFQNEGSTELNEFLSSTINEIYGWSADADWTRIWSNVFDFKRDLEIKAARFAGNLVGQVVKFIQDVDWSQVWAGVLSPFSGFSNIRAKEALKENVKDVKKRQQFEEGFYNALREPASPSIGTNENRASEFNVAQNPVFNFNIDNRGSDQDINRSDAREWGRTGEQAFFNEWLSQTNGNTNNTP